MLPTKNNPADQATCLSGTDKPLKTLEEFTSFTIAEFKHSEKVLLEEYAGRQDYLAMLHERKIAEYDFMLLLMQANILQLQGAVDMDRMMAVEKKLAWLDFARVGASYTLKNWCYFIGQKQMQTILCDVINYFIYQFEVKNKLTEQQMVQLSTKLLVAQPDLKILELVFVLNRALNGEYKHYNHIGIDTLLGWISQYYHQSADYSESRIQNGRIDEARGTQPWLEEEKRLTRFHNEQLAKKRIAEKVWGIEKQALEKQQRDEAYRQAIVKSE